MKQCGIYCYQNKINNKKYIGQSIDLKKRRSYFRETGIYSGKVFQNAIKKYGVDNFQYTILTHCKKEELNYFEKFYISRLKTNDRRYGYNLTSGGDSQYTRDEEWKQHIKNTWTEERKKDQSKKYSGKNNPNYGKKWSCELKERASEIQKLIYNEKFLKLNGFGASELYKKIEEYVFTNEHITKEDIMKHFNISYGKLNEIIENKKEIITKLEDNIKKIRDEQKKAVVQCDINDHNIILNIFSSLSEAIRITNMKSITHCVYGHQSHGCGYFWRFANNNEIPFDHINEKYIKPTSQYGKISDIAREKLKKIGSRPKPNLYKKVYCYNRCGNLLKIYDSVTSTEQDGFNPNCVSECCHNRINKSRTHKNHVFSYKELTVDEVLSKFKRKNSNAN
jgi:group I intron endonuclease